MESRRTSLPTADELAIAQIGTTALCGHCATLIRFHPSENVWRHAIVGLDHAPEPYGDAFAATNRARRLDDLLGRLHSTQETHGTSVRCPRCDAGIGKFCLKDGVTVHRSSSDIAVHPERVALAAGSESESRLMDGNR